MEAEFTETGMEAVATTEDNYTTERNKPMPSFNHGAIQANVVFQAKLKYRSKYRISSETSLRLDEWDSTPDVSIFPLSDLDLENDQVKTTKPPLGAVEILSPTQPVSELTRKSARYFEKGVKSVWIIIPEFGNVYVFSAASKYHIYQKGQVLKDKVLNIELPVSEFFE